MPSLEAEKSYGVAPSTVVGGWKYASFFSGALGLDLGLEKAGLECVSLSEIDPIACDTIKFNMNQAFSSKRKPVLYEGDIRDLSAKQVSDDIQVKPGELFAVVGGPPCQAFSTAGRRLGLNDDRGNVFLHFIHLIGKLRPKYAIFENVRGLLSCPLVHRPHNERGADYPPLSSDEMPKGALKRILALLSEYGYETTFDLYNTANFGVPQTRERLIFIASRDGSQVPLLSPTHHEFGWEGLKPWRTVRETIRSLDPRICDAGKFPESRLKYYRMLEEGQNWKNLPARVQRLAMGQSFYAGGGKTGFYRRLAWNRPAPTLVTSPTMPATDLCHPKELRPLSIQEYAELQTFPRWFTFAGRLADKYRQLGNAVPCHFGAAVGRHLIQYDQGSLPITQYERRVSRYRQTDYKSWSEEMPLSLQ